MTERRIKSSQLRSRQWFNNPDDAEMTALYTERYLNYGLTREELRDGRPIIAIAQTGSDLSPCNRHHLELASESVTASSPLAAADGNSGASDPGDREAPDGDA